MLAVLVVGTHCIVCRFQVTDWLGWRFRSCGVRCCVVGWVGPGTLNDCRALFFTVNQSLLTLKPKALWSCMLGIQRIIGPSGSRSRSFGTNWLWRWIHHDFWNVRNYWCSDMASRPSKTRMYIGSTVIFKIPSLTFVRIIVVCCIICKGMMQCCFLAKLNGQCDTCPFRYRYIWKLD